jgi:RNA polymerase sigma-70 factor (ECF subfamily)
MNTSHAWKLEAALLPAALPTSERAATVRDAASFDRLVVEEQAYVARLVGRLVGWRSDVDDLVQDVFVAALDGWARFRGDCSQRTWLTRIALNKCRSHSRRRWLRQRLFAAWRTHAESANKAAPPPTENYEIAEQVRIAVEQLRQRDREVIVLHYLEQLSAAEMAAVLTISQNAVEVRLTRARKRLKEIFSRELDLREP